MRTAGRIVRRMTTSIVSFAVPREDSRASERVQPQNEEAIYHTPAEYGYSRIGPML